MNGVVFSLWRGPIRVRAPRIAPLAESIADEYGVTVEALKGPSARRDVTWPRQELMRRALDSGMSTTQVGRFLNRDHTTVIYGARQARLRVDRAAFAAEIDTRIKRPRREKRVVAVRDPFGGTLLEKRGGDRVSAVRFA